MWNKNKCEYLSYLYVFSQKFDSLSHIITEFEMSKKHHFLSALITSSKTWSMINV